MALKDCLKCTGAGENISPAPGKMVMCKVCLGTGEAEPLPDEERDEEFQSDGEEDDDPEARHWAGHTSYLERNEETEDESDY